MRTTVGEIVLDDDPDRIDAGAAVSFLTTEAYWGRWRGRGRHQTPDPRVLARGRSL